LRLRLFRSCQRGEQSIFLFPSFGCMGGPKPGFFTENTSVAIGRNGKKTRFLGVKSASRTVSSAECFLPDHDRLSTAASKRRLPS
jgi:hypothetical protein